MSKITCQCGHENPFGTVLCEQCGRPQTEEAKNSKLVDMRYEGSARRSQTYQRSIIDKVWNFFSSVKIGVSIIIAVLATSALGTLFPQKLYVPAVREVDIAAYYEKYYGVAGVLYYKLGFYDMYNSWWFITLIGMLGISIIIASVDRVIPLYKSLKKQRTKRHVSFMRRQRIYGLDTVEDANLTMAKAEEKLKKLRYNVKVEDGAILAERGRFSRWGPYVNHVGLIIFLFGVLLRGLPGFYVDETLWLRDGETRTLPGAPGYYLKSHEFIIETYSKEEDAVFGEAIDRVGTIVKNFQSDVTLYKEAEGGLPGQSEQLEFIKDYSITVNKPLNFDGFNVFQMDYRLDELKSMTFHLTEKATNASLGEFTIDLISPETIYELAEDTFVELKDYYPDFDGFEDGKPVSKTPLPNNPGFFFKMVTPNTPEGEMSFVAIRETIETKENDYKVTFQSAETRNMTGLVVRKDKTLYILLLGGIIFMIGVTQGSYWNHRRLWIQKTENDEIVLAGHTNKNWFGLKKDLEKVKVFADLPNYEDRQDSETSSDEEKGENE
ncbi:cytochrome c biogenesis protein ResB [Sporosarcina sp. CAU 1771]